MIGISHFILSASLIDFVVPAVVVIFFFFQIQTEIEVF